MRARHDDDTSMLDIVTNISLFFMVCFMAVVGYVNVNNKDIERQLSVKADYIISVEWPAEADVDVDSYMQNPAQEMVWFSDKEAGLMHLDRDDTGSYADSFFVDGKKYEFKENREIITIRGFIPGEYILNLHMFAKRKHVGPVPVVVKIERMNPSVTTVFNDTIVLTEQSEEQHVCRFTLDDKGKLVEITKNLPVSFIDEAKAGEQP